MSRRFQSMSQARLRRTSIPDDKYLPPGMHAQGAALVQLRLRSEDAEEATRSAEHAVGRAVAEDSARLRKVAADPKATPADLKKAATAHAEGDARLVLARTERTEQAILDVQIAAEGRWTAAMRRSASERVAIVQALCEESAGPLRRAAAELVAARSVYLTHVQALADALESRDGKHPGINIVERHWVPSTKATVRFAPGGVSDVLDLSKLPAALHADSNRHVRPAPKASDVTRQATEEMAQIAAGR